jgi:hypothetical protein
MIADEVLHLMTAGVDGELSRPEAERLRRLLDDSAEARAVFAKLKTDSDRLRKLPPVAPPANLHARVMAKIAALPHQTLSEPARGRAPRESRHWVPVVLAASLLLGVAGSSFWFFINDNDTAKGKPRSAPGALDGSSDPAWAMSLPADGIRPPSAPMPQERNGSEVVRNDSRPPVEVHSVAIAPEPRTPDRDLIGALPRPKIPAFEFAEVRVPFLRSLADFEREDVRKQLSDELGRDPAFRIDLFTRDSARAVAAFQTAAKSSGLTVHADATTMNHLKKGQAGAAVVYTDSLTAEELAALFTKLNAADAKVSPRVFDVVHAAPVGRADETEIRGVLGTDPGLFKRALPERGAKELEKGASVSAGTADQIVKSIAAGQGKPGEKGAVLLTWTPGNLRTPPAMSKELASYLAKRGERKPNAVPVLIVIRYGNG